MGSVLGLRGHVAVALRHKDERYRSFVHREQLDDEYLKFWTYSNAMMEGKRRSPSVRLAHELINKPGLVMFGSGKWM
jgi:hypothetical protein